MTIKTFQGRYFFIPSKRLNELIIGVLAYAQKKYGMRICYVVFMSNHAHFLIRADSAKQVSDFFCLANSQIAKEVQRLCGWTGGIFESHCDITIVSHESEAQIARLRYLMSQGLKEGAVPHPAKWPGVHSARALMTGDMKLQGVWVRRSELYEVERAHDRRRRDAQHTRHKKPNPKRFEERVCLDLSPLPCWDDLDREEITKQSCGLCAGLLEEFAEVRATVAKGYSKRIMDRSKFCFRPAKTKKGNRPRAHAATMAVWVEYVKNWQSWLDAYRRASQRLRLGIVEAISEFPEHAFVPTGILLPTHADLPPPVAIG